ncbi:protein mms22 [Diplogelasinospora grovesii]|uniref:Protein mms22 n=1 Tax=Diplogelasinospora grovesii TaxID=303347 RepID=A0AAN6SAX2_9PEZI|nr:protein mms22 [Diplogelasinospora grovesii]
MKDWRKLGEVPDSDDESIDSPDLQQDQTSDNALERPLEAAEPLQGSNTGEVDVWSLPSSSPEEPFQHTHRRTLSKQVPRQRSLPDKDSHNDDPTNLNNEIGETATLSYPRPATPTTNEPAFPEDEISRSYVRISTPLSDSSPLSSLPSSPEPPGPEDRLQTSQRLSERRDSSIDDVDELARQTAVRLERSLRPRKPIQQHPYLLESVHYAKVMKSHGVRPIKVVVEPQSPRKRMEEDSQEGEFQAEESQEVSQGLGREGPTQSTEESEPILFDDETDDRDPLALSPSLGRTSSPARLPRTSSQPSTRDQTDATSVSGDEEFPALDNLLAASKKSRLYSRKRRRFFKASTQSKRQKSSLGTTPGSPLGSSPQRRFIPPPDWDASTPPVTSHAGFDLSQDLGNTPLSPVQRYSETTPSASSARFPSPIPLPFDRGAPDRPVLVDDDDNHSDQGDSDSASSTHSSDSGSDVVRRNVRRIRGVLPASWLRLDQQNGQQKAKDIVQNTRKTSPEPSSDQVAPRRGVALPKQGTPKPAAASLLLFDESDESIESDDGLVPLRNGTGNHSRDPPEVVVLDEDDDASVVEEDSIDRMLPGRRKRTGLFTTQQGRKRRKLDTSIQPKITQVLSRSKSASAATPPTRDSTAKPQRKQTHGNSKRRPAKRMAPPPRLSILDVMEPKAPDFIKIAARAVKRKPNLGKTSPSKKSIRLATRRDNIDALSALQDWKSGKTRPKVSVPSSARLEAPKHRHALEEIHTNLTAQSLHRQPSSWSRKIVRQSRLDGFVTVTDENTKRPVKRTQSAALPQRKTLQSRNNGMRPAQLETVEEESTRRGFTARKRALDSLYRKSGRVLGTAASLHSASLRSVDQSVFDVDPQVLGTDDDQRPGKDTDIEVPPITRKEAKANAKSRFRKRRLPQYIDLETPQYTRADDPLPFQVTVAQEAEEPDQREKLRGLGPYGTHYTHHFEIFPLDQGVFFHESTLIGRGYVKKALEAGNLEKFRRAKPTVDFVLDGQALEWGNWDDRTSSEFGILADWVAEQLASETGQSCDATTGRITDAANFVLDYVFDSLSFGGELGEKNFIVRALEVFSGFFSRSESSDWSKAPDGVKKAQLEVSVRFCLAVLAIFKLSQAASGDDPTQSLKVENLVRKAASVAIRSLLGFDLEELRVLYGDLQRLSVRQRGIRSDQMLANGWAVVMRVLENASIPRASFWDITHSVMLRPDVVSGTDAQSFESLWQDMFTLLPLCEIDDAGVLIPGLRKTAPVEGWALPQQLLKRVFQLYKANPRQPPSFNEYCRALVARCHFLIQQWGWWRKCTGIIGIIFDFFGSQNLAHLRNEEVYRSPQFLEELDRNPSLSIQPEDRCFHIFIKVLALAIQRLRQLGRVNDIRNLVARTLPNHDRQYLKEDMIHQHDLAALRNHHDLLCTLFWAAPPDQRPAVHLIEKLVVPGSAHKEACLINIRAWNQLARFVISSGEGSSAAAFKPFILWRNNTFNQVLDQYLSAAADIESQFRALSRDGMPGISEGLRDEMIAKNKATAMDVLHFSAKASLDVLKRAPTLGATVLALNLGQLQKIFSTLDFGSAGFDWALLRVALDTLEHYLGVVEKASEEQYSYSSNTDDDAIDPGQIEEAVLLLHEQMAKDFFWMGRLILALPLNSKPNLRVAQAQCVEVTVTLAARIASRFVRDRLAQLSAFFGAGRYGLFSSLPKNMTPESTAERRYLPLFLSVLIRNHVFDFKDLGVNSIFALWMLCIVKPERCLGYENRLAETLKYNNLPFLAWAAVPANANADEDGKEAAPGYNTNRDYFAAGMHYMRRSIREAGAQAARQLRDEHSKILQLAMLKMKEDLALLRNEGMGGGREHTAYMEFVREVISLIKCYGVGICVVDPFFMQPTVDYAPSVQDPQMHTAGIVAYGVRLSERDGTAVPQLFHYLYNNFKIALGNDRLKQERKILAEAVDNSVEVRGFILRYMLPAILQACLESQGACWLLLDVYTGSLRRSLTRPCVPEEIMETADDVEVVADLLGTIVLWLNKVKEGSDKREMFLREVLVVRLALGVVNMLQPGLRTYLFGLGKSVDSGLEEPLGLLGGFIYEVKRYLEGLLELEEPPVFETDDDDLAVEASWTVNMAVTALLTPLRLEVETAQHLQRWTNNPRVKEFAKTITADVKKNWVVDADGASVTVQMAGGRTVGGGTQQQASASQTRRMRKNKTMAEMLGEIYMEVRHWELGIVKRKRREEDNRKNPGNLGISGRGGKEGKEGSVEEEELIF